MLTHNNNIGKHQLIQAAVLPDLSPEAARPGYAHRDMPGRQFLFESFADHPLRPGDEYPRITVDPPIPDPVITLNAGPIRIKFDDGLNHDDGWDYTNADLVEWISNAIARFDPAFRRAPGPRPR